MMSVSLTTELPEEKSHICCVAGMEEGMYLVNR